MATKLQTIDLNTGELTGIVAVARIPLLAAGSLIDAGADLDSFVTLSAQQSLILSLATAVQIRLLGSGKVGSPSFSFDGLLIDYGSGGTDQTLTFGAAVVVNNNGFFGPIVISTSLVDVQQLKIKHSADSLDGSNKLTLFAELIAIVKR